MQEPKRRGRPPLDPDDGRPSEPVQVKLSAADYEAVVRAASGRRESIQDLLRRALRHDLKLPD